jgi:sodium/bile acid cotransporter 7
VLAICAIGSLFFLQGARLSHDAVVGGITHWRLHATIAMTTFVLFPTVGWVLRYLFPQLLTPMIWVGVMFLCALPSTVQSSVALISIAQGNVAGAVCSATLSTVAGIVLTPLLFGAISDLQGGRTAVGNIGQVLLELMVPFLLGHLLRPWIGQWAERNRHLLTVTDRSSILLVVYAAFSAAVINGVWNQLPHVVMALTLLVVALLLITGLLATIITPSILGFDREDRIAVMFCGSQKSLITAVPLANVLFPAATVGPVLIPIMIYHPIQLVAGAWLARRLARPTRTDEQIIAIEPTTIVQAIAARVPEQAR